MSEEKRIALIKALPGAGHITAAVIYVTMGILAAFLAFGARGRTPDVRGAVRTLRDQPFGPAVLLVVAAGSIALLVWRWLQAFADIESKGRTLAGLAQRARYFFSGLFYAGLPVLVWKMLAGVPIRSSDHWARRIAGEVIAFPFGWTILLAVGAGLFVYGLVCAYRLIRGNFHTWFHCEQMTARQQKILFALGRLGYAARGTIAFMVGYFVLLAGWHVNPNEAAAQAGAMDRVVRQPYGSLVLGMIALGLICLGLFSLGAARYGKLPVHKVNQLLRWCQRRLTGKSRGRSTA